MQWVRWQIQGPRVRTRSGPIDHEIISPIILLPYADSRRAVVSYKQNPSITLKCMFMALNILLISKINIS